MSGLVLWVVGILVAQFVVVMVMLGTWIEDGRRRAREIERLEALARDLGMPAQRTPGGSSLDVG